MWSNVSIVCKRMQDFVFIRRVSFFLFFISLKLSWTHRWLWNSFSLRCYFFFLLKFVCIFRAVFKVSLNDYKFVVVVTVVWRIGDELHFLLNEIMSPPINYFVCLHFALNCTMPWVHCARQCFPIPVSIVCEVSIVVDARHRINGTTKWNLWSRLCLFDDHNYVIWANSRFLLL